jgi:AsmA protein
MDFSDVDVHMKAGRGTLRLNPLKASLYGGSYAGNILIDARGDVPVMNLNEQVKNVDTHALLTAAGAGTGALDLRGGRTTIALKARVTTDAAGKTVRANGIALTGKVGGKAFKGGAVPISLNGNVAVDLGARRATLAAIKAAFAELKLGGDMQVGFAPGAMSYAGTLNISRLNVRALARRLGVSLPNTSDAKAFTAVTLKSTVEGNANGVKLTGLKGGLDGSTISGDLSVSNFGDPAFAFDLNMDRLNTNRYVPPAARSKGKRKAKNKGKGKAATPGAAATALPVDLVRGLKLNGTLKVGRLTVGGLKMRKVRLTAVAKGGQLKLSPLAATLYGGRYDGNVTVDARDRIPLIALDETVKGIQLGPLLKDVSGDAPVTGTADLRAVLTATGGDAERLKRTVDGDVNFTIANGALEKIDMVNSMCTTLAALDFDNLNKKTITAGVIGLLLNSTQNKPRANAGADGEGRTRFTEMRGSAHLTKGVARNEDLLMTSPVVRVRGAGTVDLPGDRIKYRAEAELVQSCAGIGKRDLAGQIIPVNISGPIADPKVSPEIPSGLISALRKRRSSQPAASAPAQGRNNSRSNPDQRASPPPDQPAPKKRGHLIKESRDDLLKGLLKGILK